MEKGSGKSMILSLVLSRSSEDDRIISERAPTLLKLNDTPSLYAGCKEVDGEAVRLQSV